MFKFFKNDKPLTDKKKEDFLTRAQFEIIRLEPGDILHLSVPVGNLPISRTKELLESCRATMQEALKASGKDNQLVITAAREF